MAIDYSKMYAKYGKTKAPPTPTPSSVDTEEVDSQSQPKGIFGHVEQAQQPKGPTWWDSVKNTVGTATSAVGNFGVGVEKGIMDIPREVASLGSDIGLRGAAAIKPGVSYEQLKTAAQNQGGMAANLLAGQTKGTEQTGFTKPQGTAQELGYNAEKIGEFFVPVGGAGKALATGEKLLTKGEKVLSTGEKLAGFGKKAAQLGKKSVSEALEFGARTALQEGKADEKTVNAAMIGAAMPVVGAGLGLIKGQLPKWSQALEEVNLRLTPQQRRTMGDKIGDVTKFLSDKKVIGTANKRLEKVDKLYQEIEPKLETFLNSAEVKARPVDKAKVLDDLESLKANYQDRIDTDVIEGQIDKIKNQLEAKQADKISHASLNKLKRSAYDSAYNEAGNKVLDDVMHDVGDTLRKNVESGTEGLKLGGKSIGEFNKEYGTILNARKLLKTAASRKDVGFLTKLISSFAGGSVGTAIGGPLGTAIGASMAPGIAETVAGTAPRSVLAAGLKKVAESKTPAALATIAKGITSQVTQQ